ncbi:hypothetical protein, partial [Methyloglobulus sp.]|uniref:hypothetical protein n=1 Tax=Methyloglobulus sp. TaxID=2518622 RepID=UPI0032B72FA3
WRPCGSGSAWTGCWTGSQGSTGWGSSDLDDVERASVEADWDAHDAGERPAPPHDPRPQVVNDPPLRMRGHSKDHRPGLVQQVSAAKMQDGGREFWMRGEWPEAALPILEKLGVRKGPRTWSVGSGSKDLEASEPM